MWWYCLWDKEKGRVNGLKYLKNQEKNKVIVEELKAVIAQRVLKRMQK